MGLLSELVSIGSFVSGIVFGILICAAGAVHFLRRANDDAVKSEKHKRSRTTLAPEIPPKSIDQLVAPEDLATVKRLIQFLEDFNAPLKSIGGYLQQIYKNRENNVKITKEFLDRKARVIVDPGTINRMEEEMKANVANLREHGKTMKNISSFLSDLGRSFASFSKDLNRLSHTAKNNMYKGLKDLSIDTKEDMIINNWWQALHVALDYMASDQEYLATQISEDLLNFSTQIHDELTVIEKRLSTEGSKQVHNIRENLSLYESKRRERDKYREKVRLQGNSATLTTQSPAEIAQRRALKMKINDDHLTIQTSKLFTAQKEFFSLMPRIDADIQLTILKSIVESHSQLLKLTESFERQQESNRMISKRMKLQLTNAAASLMQMIKEEGNFLSPSATTLAAAAAGVTGAENITTGMYGAGEGGSQEPEIVAYEEALRARMLESGLQGYELSLQRVLEGLLHHCQHFDFTYGLAQSPQAHLQAQGGTITSSSSAPAGSVGTGLPDDPASNVAESRGELNMAKESTACLAAANPAILPLLPSRFGAAVGVETCVWFNAFSGRVYRDISNSAYFYNWFCHKLTIMLNKGARPDYIDEFKVTDIAFGALPPLLLNVQWSPPCKTGPFDVPPGEDARRADSAKARTKTGDSPSTKGTGAAAGSSAGASNRAFIYDESDSSGSDRETDSRRRGSTAAAGTSAAGAASEEETARRRRDKFKVPPPKVDESEYFAACTADMAHRSGIKFTVTTKYVCHLLSTVASS
jgi:hypothetical protein